MGNYSGYHLGLFEAVILLPTTADAATWAKAQSPETWREALLREHFADRKGDLVLPRLDVTAAAEMKAAAEAVGLRGAFSPAADFSGMATRPISLDEIVHKCVLKLTEEGVEAAAGSAALARPGATLDAPKPFVMVVERPFVFVLRHVETGTILLTGVIDDPGPPPILTRVAYSSMTSPSYPGSTPAGSSQRSVS